MIECLFCQKQIPDDAIFCCYCGKRQIKTTKRTKRGNGMGTVYKDEQGKYIAEFTIGYYSCNGKWIRKKKRKKGFTTKKAALEWIEETKRNNVVIKTISVSELWEKFQKNNADMSKSKLSAYKIAYNKVKNEIEHRKIDSFTVSELQDIVDEYGNSYYTKKDIKNLLSHFYKIALQDEYVSSNKTQYIKLPKHETKERETFSENDIQLIWNDWRINPSRITSAILIMLYTGMRPAEVLGLSAENLHIEEHYLTGGVKTEKSKNRKIIIPQVIVPVFEYLISLNNIKLSGYTNKNDFYEEWQEKRDDLKLSPDLSPYCCRHTYVTALTMMNASPAMLQELVGHEDYDTTLIYTHLSVKDRYDFVNKLNYGEEKGVTKGVTN